MTTQPTPATTDGDGDANSEGAPAFWPEARAAIDAAPIGFLATVNQAQPTVRAVTPTYEGLVAYIATDPNSFKVRNVTTNPLVELLHWTTDFRHVRIRGRASLVTDEATKVRLWDTFSYNLTDFFGAVDSPTYGLLQIEPFRIELSSLERVATGKPPEVWRRS